MHKDSASRTQWQKKPSFFIDIVETKPILPEQSEGTIVQVEHNGKKIHFFLLTLLRRKILRVLGEALGWEAVSLINVAMFNRAKHGQFTKS